MEAEEHDFFSQTICLMYYCQDRETVLANMTKSYFIKVANFCFNNIIHVFLFIERLFTD